MSTYDMGSYNPPQRTEAESRLKQAAPELLAALNTIAKGMTNEFPGAPDPMTATSPVEFRAAMWSWSQKVAAAAVNKVGMS